MPEVAFCMKILKKVNKIKIGKVMTYLARYNFVILAEVKGVVVLLLVEPFSLTGDSDHGC